MLFKEVGFILLKCNYIIFPSPIPFFFSLSNFCGLLPLATSQIPGLCFLCYCNTHTLTHNLAKPSLVLLYMYAISRLTI